MSGIPRAISTSVPLQSLLRCPVCCASLDRHSDGYVCPSCGRIYADILGVPRFVDPANYADTFGYQ